MTCAEFGTPAGDRLDGLASSSMPMNAVLHEAPEIPAEVLIRQAVAQA